MPRWNANTVTVADVEAAQAAADAAQATADAAQTAADGAQATADAAMPADFYSPAVPIGTLFRLTGGPGTGGATATGSLEGGRIFYFPVATPVAVTIDQWRIEQTAVTTGTSLVLRFARYSTLADGTPGDLLEDYTSKGTVALLNNPTLPADAFAAASAVFGTSLVIPAGNWRFACLALGTTGTLPTVRFLAGHPGIGAGLPTSLNSLGGYRSPDALNAAFPPAAVVNLADQARGGLALWARRA